jgi:hypothetical protein
MNDTMRIALLAVLLATSTMPMLATHAVAGYPTYGAPGPLLGAGVPVLVVAGGIYWVARRFRRKSDS